MIGGILKLQDNKYWFCNELWNEVKSYLVHNNNICHNCKKTTTCRLWRNVTYNNKKTTFKSPIEKNYNVVYVDEENDAKIMTSRIVIDKYECGMCWGRNDYISISIDEKLRKKMFKYDLFTEHRLKKTKDNILGFIRNVITSTKNYNKRKKETNDERIQYLIEDIQEEKRRNATKELKPLFREMFYRNLIKKFNKKELLLNDYILIIQKCSYYDSDYTMMDIHMYNNILKSYSSYFKNVKCIDYF
jgi:hypothetical protein